MVDVVNALREAAHPLTGEAADHDPLMGLIGGARFVLLGEASHGTHEFYRERAHLTKRLIRSLQHEGWLVTTEVLGAEVGAQVEAQELPLRGVTAELKGGEDAITIIVGGKEAGRVTHIITRPAHVRVEQAEDGADTTLRIESGGGVTTLVRFRSAVLPEMVDGVVFE